jgi:hypothetical protein
MNWGSPPATAFEDMTDFQILKSVAVYDVEKTRTIKLMAALFNENNTKLARDMMFHTEQAHMADGDQHGSRKDHDSKRLTGEMVVSLDIPRQHRLAATHISLDASQCYDRMAHPPARLCMIQHGAHPPAVRSMFKVLQNANNKVATAFGVSKHTYGGRKRTSRGLSPCQGAGQGNGAGPGAFFSESCTLIGCMKKKGFSTFTVACLSLIKLFYYCFLFVDDQNQQHVAESTSTTGEQMVPLAQASLTHWVNANATH